VAVAGRVLDALDLRCPPWEDAVLLAGVLAVLVAMLARIVEVAG
jgi:hypothetical protein